MFGNPEIHSTLERDRGSSPRRSKGPTVTDGQSVALGVAFNTGQSTGVSTRYGAFKCPSTIGLKLSFAPAGVVSSPSSCPPPQNGQGIGVHTPPFPATVDWDGFLYRSPETDRRCPLGGEAVLTAKLLTGQGLWVLPPPFIGAHVDSHTNKNGREETQHDTEHPVRARVLWPHVEHQFVGVEGAAMRNSIWHRQVEGERTGSAAGEATTQTPDL